MADGKIKISELTQALQINNDAVFPYVQDNGGADATFKSPITQIARKIAEDVDYTNLETSTKDLVGAINQTVDNFAETYDPTRTYNQGDPALYAGTLYKCNTNNTTGTWDSTKWDQAKAVDFGSGGGGSGGHTIVDGDGTSLTQRSNLQFNGVYLEDNSADDTTEVNVVREMSKSDFDNLSDDEKKGFINVTDDIGNGLKYVKTTLFENVDESNLTILNNGDTILLTDNILDYDEIYFEGCFYESGNATGKKLTHLAVTKVMRDTIAFAKSKYGTGQYEGMFDVAHNFIVSGQTYCFMYCLKVPTDSSFYLAFKYVNGWNGNSCTLTRIIGVKYLNEEEKTYSTEEQIVGKWIDGSTLYQKTISLGALPNNGTGTVAHGISNLARVVEYFGGAYDSNSEVNMPLPFVGSNFIAISVIGANINITDNSDRSNMNGYLTLRYTKAST